MDTQQWTERRFIKSIDQCIPGIRQLVNEVVSGTLDDATEFSGLVVEFSDTFNKNEGPYIHLSDITDSEGREVKVRHRRIVEVTLWPNVGMLALPGCRKCGTVDTGRFIDHEAQVVAFGAVLCIDCAYAVEEDEPNVRCEYCDGPVQLADIGWRICNTCVGPNDEVPDIAHAHCACHSDPDHHHNRGRKQTH